MTKNVTELWGHEFNIVRNGLSEAQVVSYVNELVSEHDMLIQRQEHLTSLTKLAEKTVTEAEKLAEEIKAEVKDHAKAEAAEILAKAEEQAQQMIEEKRTEIITIANEKAAAIQAEAEQKAELLLENQRKRIQPELRNLVHQLYSQLLSELESLKQQAVGFEVEFERKLSQPAEEISTVTVEEDERHDEFLELTQTTDQTSTGEPEWELEILPPIDIMKIMRIVTHLDSLPQVEKTELIPETDKPLIIVFLREPIDLIDVMRTLPGVAQVKEDTTDTAGADGKPRKVQIVLSEKSVLDETKERLKSEVSDILSELP